jgi:hypothetical protein
MGYAFDVVPELCLSMGLDSTESLQHGIVPETATGTFTIK